MNPARDLGPRIFTAMAGYGREVFNFRQCVLANASSSTVRPTVYITANIGCGGESYPQLSVLLLPHLYMTFSCTQGVKVSGIDRMCFLNSVNVKGSICTYHHRIQ